MTTARWQRIEEIFQDAADLGPEERAAFLTQACEGDHSLLKEVESLLGTDSNIEGAVEASIRREAASLAARASESVVGKRIGPYRITAVIGSGGMGTVYRATRDDDQFQKDVAIKIVKRGMDFDALLVRFRRERQILARLDHPNIARLLDGGATDDGLPYFVLEYVDGVPLTQYCAGKPLTERLRLFRTICAAVQYAHQNLVVHRDLKPANILITSDGVPKLLDFGLAKLLNPDQVTEHTVTWMRMLTPDYASPEQVRGEAITTSSDIYSLGAVLYELVSGHSAHQFETRSTAEMERVICETDPAPLEGELGSVAQMALRHEPERRYATVEQFSEDIRRHLDGLPVVARNDTIFYRSGKFLRRNRWAAMTAALAVLGLLATTIFAIRKAREAGEQRQAAEASSVKAQAETRRAEESRAEAQAEARRTEAARAEAILQAEESRQFAGDAITSINGKLNEIPGTLKARGELALVTLQYLERLAAKAPHNTKFQMDLARAYLTTAMLEYNIGQPSLYHFEPSLANLQKARTIIESLIRADPANPALRAAQATMFNQTGITTAGMGKHAEALDWLRKAKSLSAVNGKPPPGIYRVVPEGQFNMIAWELFELGDFRAVIGMLRDDNVRRWRALASIGDLTTGWAKLEPRVKRLPAGLGLRPLESHEAEMLRTARMHDGEQGRPNVPHANVLGVIAALNRGVFLELAGHPLKLNLGKTEVALQAARENISIWSAALASDPDNGSARHYVSDNCAEEGALLRESNPTESVSAYRSAIGGITTLLEMTPANLEFQRLLARYHAEIALPLRKLGRQAEARDSLIRALQSEAALGEPRSFTRREFGDLELEAGERKQALEHYQASLQLAHQRIKSRPQDMLARRELADTHERLGRLYESSRDWNAAREWYARSMEVWTTWTKYGLSSPYNETREKQAAENVDRCGRILLTNSPK